MEDNLHTVDAQWRETEALALEAKARAVDEWLDHTEELVKMFNGDATVSSSLRGCAGTLRSRKNDFDTAAGKLRAEMNERNGWTK